MCSNKIIAFGLVLFFAGSIICQKTQAQTRYPDTLWVPVIFYDYWVDNNETNPDFEIAPSQAVTGMIYDTMDWQRKPVPTPVACPANPSNAPAACHLAEWYRMSGQGGSDMSGIFSCDSTTNTDMRRWYWTTSTGGALVPYLNRVGEFVGPSYDSTYNMRNIIIYDSLPFIHLGITDASQTGIYEYRNDSFFRLDNRGFGNQPSGQNHNFGFSMELHTVFEYKSGLNFTFTGDDDAWVFINGKKVVDLGGRHPSLSRSISLDTMSGFVVGKKYSLDFFYAERHTTQSHILINSNIIAFQPQTIHIQVIPGDTICAGDTATIIGTLYGKDGKPIPQLSDSISWSLVTNSTKQGDHVRTSLNDSTWFTGTVAWRKAGIIGSYLFGNIWIIDTNWIYIKACTPSQLDIVQQNTTALTSTQVINALDPNQALAPITIPFDTVTARKYVYAVLRDQYNNFVSIADAASWVSRDPTTVTIAGTSGKQFEGAIGHTTVFQSVSVRIVVSQGSFAPDSALVVLQAAKPISELTSAVTKDLDGNGLIDHIAITFNMATTLNNSMIAGFLVKGNGYVFPIDSITKINDSTYLLDLREIKTSVPQTAWTPDLTITFVQDVKPVVIFHTTDGCPPVVWEVKKFIADESRSHDTVKVYMSEKITDQAGNPFSASTLPADVFNVWLANGTTLVQVDAMLDGIPGFFTITSDSILVFTMDNSKDLSTNNYINLNFINSKIKDVAGNPPAEINQRVKVYVVYIDIFAIFTGPNPARPSLAHPEPLEFKHNSNAITWAKQGQGTVISLKNIPVPQNADGPKNVSASIKILDVIGNTVNWISTSDAFAGINISGGMIPEMDIYWNGLNKNGMVVAPGIYRSVLYINYPSNSKIPNVKVISKLGITH
jgi:fibro-slime domain-containing protein